MGHDWKKLLLGEHFIDPPVQCHCHLSKNVWWRRRQEKTVARGWPWLALLRNTEKMQAAEHRG